MSKHAKEFEPKIRRIQDQLGKMTKENHAEQLLQIIHRPGFTTVLDVQFVHALLDSVTNHLDVVDRTHRALVTIAEQIAPKAQAQGK